MINIVIIDDEPLVRASIQSFLDWESYGFSFIGEASDGLSGLKLLEDLEDIDLILLDMHMPKMDGLEFLHSINKFVNPPKVIVLSANDHYDYVRKSFQLGAIDYILKMDIDEKNLLTILQKTEKIFNTPEKKQSVIKSKDIEYMGQKLIQDLLENRNLEITMSLLNDIGIEIKPPVCLCSLWLNNIEIDNDITNDLELIMIQGRQFLKKRASGYLFSINNGEWLFIINMDVVKSNQQSFSEEFCKDFVSIILDGLGLELDFGVSPICDELHRLPEYLKYVKSLQHPETRMVRKAKKYIRLNYANNNLSLEDLSSYVQVSKAHLSAQFKKETEMTFREYLTRIRVDEAKKILLNTNLKVYEVSELVGYPNVEHFSRIFKKVTNMTPNRFATNK